MIESIEIQNYKSIKKLKLDVGQVTVLIGENGCGKSNILEAITFAGAAAANKLDSEFLESRGVRVTDEPELMHSAFDQPDPKATIDLNLTGEGEHPISLKYVGAPPYGKWRPIYGLPIYEHIIETRLRHMKTPDQQKKEVSQLINTAIKEYEAEMSNISYRDFVIYSPESTALRRFEDKGQIQPLGIKGEGLFKLLKVLHASEPHKIDEIKQRLSLISWFKDFDIPQNLAPGEATIRIWDKFLFEGLEGFSQRSTNEGFLFLLFYLTLFISDQTPKFFAIDNIETALNPKLCNRLMVEITALAKTHEKQVIITTHNPAILDGLNLDDDAVRLLVISRNSDGHTHARRITKPRLVGDESPAKLSEAFMAGSIGGLPRDFVEALDTQVVSTR